MATRDTIAEFLVAIGYKNDDVAQRKIVEGLGKLEKGLLGIVAAAEGASLAIVASLGKMAESFEKAYYASSRTGVAVRELNAFKYAASQTGATAEEAAAAVEGLAEKIKGNRGYRDLVTGITKDRTGDYAKQITELGEKFKSMSSERAVATANMLGLSPVLRQSLMNPEFTQFEKEYENKANAMGVDLEKAAADGKSLTQALRGVQTTLGLIVDAAATPLFQKLDGPIRALNDLLEKRGKAIADVIGNIAGALLQLSTWILDHLADLDKLGLTMDGWEKVFAGLATVVTLALVSRLTGLLGALKGISMLGMPPWALALLGVGAAGVAVHAAIEKDGDVGYEESKRRDAENESPVTRLWNWGKRKLGYGGGGGGVGTARQSENASAVMDELRKAGLPPEGIAAALGSMQTESGMNPAVPENAYNRGHRGLIQWDSTRWPKVAAWIKSQGGDPYDARWQARAFVAEGRAKPGDAIYDGPQTQRGFRALEGSAGNLGLAVQGMGGIERFGPGEEGGRAANARAWMPHVSSPAKVPPMVRVRPGEVFVPGHNGGPVPMPQGMPPPAPLGAHSSNDNSKSVIINDNSKTEVHGVNDPAKAANHVGSADDRRQSILLRNLQSAIG